MIVGRKHLIKMVLFNCSFKWLSSFQIISLGGCLWNTYSYKKVDHKKYVKGKVDLLSNIVAPFLASLNLFTANKHVYKQREQIRKSVNNHEQFHLKPFL